MRPTRSVAVVAAVATVAALSAAVPAGAAVPTDTSKLRDAVTAAGVFQHLQEFQAIADANDGTRQAATAGYDESADYVAAQLMAAGYEVTRQPFEFAFFSEVSRRSSNG